ncbi:phage tail tube protein [Nevskia sp.]|uniref:phage tail tube protein n=1 Tax=Nevskia sp. TaxID=1929292 RepID=UPI003F70BB73
MASRILGRATIKVDSRVILSKRGSTLDIGGVKRTPVVGALKVHGFTEEIMAPMLDVKITQTPGFGPEQLRAIADATIVFAGDDGIEYTLVGAFTTDVPKLSENEGEIEVQFSAIECVRSAG